MPEAAVFLDRDGTINEEVNYLSRIEDLQLIPGAIEAIRLLNQAQIRAIVISNQAGVARGFFTEDRVKQIHDHLNKILISSDARLDGIYYCPHHPTAGKGKYKIDCDCRKPKPGLLFQAARAFDIDLNMSYLIGDKKTDLDAGRAAGCRTILVRTGYGKQTEQELGIEDWPDYIADHVLAAVRWILQPARMAR